MVNYLIYLLVVSIVTVSTLRVWFSSELMKGLLTTIHNAKWHLNDKFELAAKGTEFPEWSRAQKVRDRIKWFFLSILSCWQCSSYWVSWFYATVVLLLIPNAPLALSNIGGIFITGVFSAYVSEFLHRWVEIPNESL